MLSLTSIYSCMCKRLPTANLDGCFQLEKRRLGQENGSWSHAQAWWRHIFHQASIQNKSGARGGSRVARVGRYQLLRANLLRCRYRSKRACEYAVFACPQTPVNKNQKQQQQQQQQQQSKSEQIKSKNKIINKQKTYLQFMFWQCNIPIREAPRWTMLHDWTNTTTTKAEAKKK